MGVVKHVFQRHDFSFKATFAEMATCTPKSGMSWALNDVIKHTKIISQLPGF